MIRKKRQSCLFKVSICCHTKKEHEAGCHIAISWDHIQLIMLCHPALHYIWPQFLSNHRPWCVFWQPLPHSPSLLIVFNQSALFPTSYKHIYFTYIILWHPALCYSGSHLLLNHGRNHFHLDSAHISYHCLRQYTLCPTPQNHMHFLP